MTYMILVPMFRPGTDWDHSPEDSKVQRNLEQSITQNSKQNPRAFWKYVKSQLKTHSQNMDILDHNGNKVHSDSKKA